MCPSTRPRSHASTRYYPRRGLSWDTKGPALPPHRMVTVLPSVSKVYTTRYTILKYNIHLYMYGLLYLYPYYTIIVILYRDPSIVNEIAPWAQKRLDSYAGLIESRLQSMAKRAATTEEEEEKD